MPTKDNGQPTGKPSGNVDVSTEKCALCLDKFGTTADNAEVVQYGFPDDGASRAAFMAKYSLPEDSLVCASCVDSGAKFDPLEYILANALSMDSKELFYYIIQKDILMQLMRTDKGEKMLVETIGGDGQTALHTALGDPDIALELVRNPDYVEFLGETEASDFYASELFFAVRWNEKVAMEFVKTLEGMKRLSKIKTHSYGFVYLSAGRSVLHEAVTRHPIVALKAIETMDGMRLLKETADDGGTSVLHAVAEFPHVAETLVENPDYVRMLAEARDGEGSSALHIVSSSYEAALKLIRNPDYVRIMADTKDKRGVSALRKAAGWHKIAILLLEDSVYIKLLAKDVDESGVSTLRHIVMGVPILNKFAEAEGGWQLMLRLSNADCGDLDQSCIALVKKILRE